LAREIEQLKKRLLHLSAVVEENLQRAVDAILARDEVLAAQAIERDREIDRMEVDLEEECLKVLALHQPVAADLRYIVACMKINNDLERIGDLACNIAKRAKDMARLPEALVPKDLREMAHRAQTMLRLCMDAYINHDPGLANRVCDMDDEVDDINRVVKEKVEKTILESPNAIKPLMRIFSVARYVERIADLTTNIGQDVIYMLEGEIVRHKPPGTGETARRET
jgi:phosphate transport system protein